MDTGPSGGASGTAFNFGSNFEVSIFCHLFSRSVARSIVSNVDSPSRSPSALRRVWRPWRHILVAFAPPRYTYGGQGPRLIVPILGSTDGPGSPKVVSIPTVAATVAEKGDTLNQPSQPIPPKMAVAATPTPNAVSRPLAPISRKSPIPSGLRPFVSTREVGRL